MAEPFLRWIGIPYKSRPDGSEQTELPQEELPKEELPQEEYATSSVYDDGPELVSNDDSSSPQFMPISYGGRVRFEAYDEVDRISSFTSAVAEPLGMQHLDKDEEACEMNKGREQDPEERVKKDSVTNVMDRGRPNKSARQRRIDDEILRGVEV